MGIDAAEKRRLDDAQVNRAAWTKWGPRSRAHRWGEHGLGGGPGAQAATARALHGTQGPGFETRR